MRFLIDQCISPRLADWLMTSGHDAIHVRLLRLSRASDEEVFALAIQQDRIIVTSDLDFSRVLALSGRDRPGLILFRAGNVTDEQMLHLTAFVLSKVPEDQIVRSVVVVDEYALRVAPLPLRPDLTESSD